MSVPLDPLETAITADRCGDEASSSRRARRAGASAGEWLRNRVYGFSDLSRYGARDRFIIRAADLFFYLLTRLICSSVRWEVQGREHLDSILSGGRRPIFTSWHSCLLSATWFWRNRGIVVMSSRSRDAEYTGRVIQRFGYGTVRGSSTRGGVRALAEMVDCLNEGLEAGFTIDGPRGPAYVAKRGAVTLARHTGQAILPFHIAARRYIELPSWDRLQIPLPFTRALVLIGEPIYVARSEGANGAATKHESLQLSLDSLRQRGEEWRKGKSQGASRRA